MLSARQVLKLVVLAAIATAFLAPSAIAVEGDMITLTDANGVATLGGTVAATEDANGVITDVQLNKATFLRCVLKDANGVVKDTSVEIGLGEKPLLVVLDATGKQLGKEMNGKEVEVKGGLIGDMFKNEQMWIKVNSFKADPNAVTLKGTVAVTEDANGVITAVQLDKVTYLQVVLKDANGIDKTVEATVDNKMTYQVVLDAAGRQLGKEMNGKEAKVIGVVSTEGEQKWIKVHSFKAVVKK